MTGSKPSRVAVIGCGTIAHEHLSYLHASPLVTLVGVCDSSRALAECLGSRFGAAECYTDYRQMLANLQADVIHVLTPPHTHVEIAGDAIRAGSHVVCEKPLTPSLGETAELLRLARENERRLCESQNLRFNDVTIMIDRLVTGGRLGAVQEVDVLLSLDLTAGQFGDVNLAGPGVKLSGGAVHDFLPHLAYLFLHFAGEPRSVDEICGSIRNHSGNPRVGFDHLDALVRTGSIAGRLRISSTVKPDAFRLAVRGDTASVEVDFYNPFHRFEGGTLAGKLAPFEQIRSGFGLIRSGLDNLRAKVAGRGTYHGLPRMLDAFYRNLSTGAPPPVTEEQMLGTAALVERLVELRDDR